MSADQPPPVKRARSEYGPASRSRVSGVTMEPRESHSTVPPPTPPPVAAAASAAAAGTTARRVPSTVASSVDALQAAASSLAGSHVEEFMAESDVRMQLQIRRLPEEHAAPLCVFRGVLCFCTSGASLGVVDLLQLQCGVVSESSASVGAVLMGLRVEEETADVEHTAHAIAHPHPTHTAHDPVGLAGGSPSPSLSPSHSSSCRSVLVKTSIGFDTSAEQIARIRYEVVMAEKVFAASCQPATAAAAATTTPTGTATAAVVAPHLRQLADGRLALILPDTGGSTLRQLLTQRELIEQRRLHQQQLLAAQRDREAGGATVLGATAATAAAARPLPTLSTMRTAVEFTLALARKLQVMHQLRISLTNLAPVNILLNPISCGVTFLDLSSASLLGKNRAEPNEANLHSHTTNKWLYAAPEISGKANRIIDARSDLYSLGCILHELMTGRPPFQSEDALELIHQHLAKSPPSLLPRMSRHAAATSSISPALLSALTVVDAIVQKLLQKQAEDRYQSTAGLIHDLDYLLTWTRRAKWSDESPRDPHSASLSPEIAARRPPSLTSSPSPTIGSTRAGLHTGTNDRPLSSAASASSSSSSAAAASSLSDFQVASLDEHSTFRLGQHLYGREEQIEQLTRAYRRVCQRATPATAFRRATDTRLTITDIKGGSNQRAESSATAAPRAATVPPHLLLVAGSSGSGKSVLVDELHKHILRQRGLFARGKFDLLKRDSSCLLQAFRHLVLQLLVTDAITWKVRLLRALGSNGQVICDIIPELTRLIGDQPPVPKLSTSETANRFNMVFLQFVSALAAATSPLTLFIDDVQWADSGSLSLLLMLLTQDSSHLLIILAYRDNEVDAAHPLMKVIGEARQLERVTEVTLRPLTTHHITQLIVDSFRCDDATAQPLAQLLAVKTQGSPFFVSTMLRTFYDSGLLRFNFTTSRWEWQLEAMRLSAVADDVVSVLCSQMLTMSAASQQFLQYAACSGNTFNLHTLAVMTQMPTDALVAAACELVHAGLLLCTSHAQELVLLQEEIRQATQTSVKRSPLPMMRASSGASQTANPAAATADGDTSVLASIVLKFSHDKIQLAAYQLIPPADLSALHCTIARQLLSSYTEHECVEHAISIVSHVNTGFLLAEDAATETKTGAGHPDANANADASFPDAAAPSPLNSPHWREFFSAPSILDRVISLESIAGQQAKASGAYEVAVELFSAAILLMLKKSAPLKVNSAVIEHSRKRRRSESHLTMQPDSGVTAAAAASTSSPRAVQLSDSHTASDPPDSIDSFLALPASCWRDSYKTCLQLYQELSASHFLASDYHQSAACIEYALHHIRDIHDRATLFQLLVQSLNQFDMPRSIATGLSALKELGFVTLTQLTPDLDRWIRDFPMGLTHDEAIKVHPVFTMTEMSDPLDLHAIALCATLTPTLYYLCDPVFNHLAISMLHLTKTRGVCPASAYAMAMYSVCIWPTHTEYALHSALGRLASLLLDQYGEIGRPMRPSTNTIACVLNNLWHLPLPEVTRLTEHAFDDALVARDWEWATHLGMYVNEYVVLSNVKLPQALPRQRTFAKGLVKRKLALASQYSQLWIDANELLAGLTVPTRPPPTFDALPLMQLGRNISRGMVDFYRRSIDSALDCFEAAAATIDAAPCVPPNISYNFYRALTLLASCPTAAITIDAHGLTTHLTDEYDSSLVMRRLADADALIRLVAIWSTTAPHTFVHKLELLQAERNRCAIFSHLACHHLILPTIHLYEQSADHAARCGFPLEEALANELLARFLFASQRQAMASQSLKRCYAAYALYGACMKLQQLKTEYPNESLEAFAAPLYPRTSHADAPTTSSSASYISGSSSVMMDEPGESKTAPHDHSPTSRAADSFDVISVLKATASFSTEKDRQKLLKRLMRIVLETAGATRGVLVLEDPHSKEWSVELSASLDSHRRRSVTDLVETTPDAPDDDVPMDEADPTRPSVDLHNSSQTSTSSSSISAGGQRIRIGVSAAVGSLSVESALPFSVFEFVTAAKEVLVVSEMSVSFAAFGQDAYFNRHRPKALLCMPVLRGGEVFGVLYLENDFNLDAFTSSHIQLLQLLCTQAALSIDNARLYTQLSSTNADLESLVARRTSEIESLQVAMDRAEKATKIKADFLSNMSHEIRTPMNAVLGIGRLLADTKLSLEQQQYVSMINNSGHLLLTIINDILDYSKIEAGHLMLSPSANNLADVVETAVMLCYDMAQSKGLSSSWYIDPALPAALMIDASRLQQILLNLLSNAIKFTKSGGVDMLVTLHAHSTQAVGDFSSPQPSSTRAPCIVEFSVRDTGIGISSAQLSSLFQAFSQVQHTSGEYGGTGLGLVISKRLVEAMGGTINVESLPGRGSTFSFQLPLPRAHVCLSSATTCEPATPAAAAASPPSASRYKGRLHGLSPAEVETLHRTNLLFIGAPNAARAGWVNLCQYYAQCVAVPDLSEALRSLGSHGSDVTAATSSPSLPTAVIVDLDTISEGEERCAEQIRRFGPMKLLFLFSKPNGIAAELTEDEVHAAAGAATHAHHRLQTRQPKQTSAHGTHVAPPTVRFIDTVDVTDATESRPASFTPFDRGVGHVRRPFAARTFLRCLISLIMPPSVPAPSPFIGAMRQISGAWLADLDLTNSSLLDLGHLQSAPAAATASASATADRDHAVSMMPPPLPPPINLTRPPMSTRITNIAHQYPLRILLAEDNLINQKMMVMMMRKLGYTMVLAKNGTEALQRLEAEANRGREHEIECILMDASMDVMDGMECTRIIRAQQLSHRTRPFIIAQTANVTEEYRQLCLQAGMDMFTCKPVNIDELVRCLQHAYAVHHAPTMRLHALTTAPSDTGEVNDVSSSSGQENKSNTTLNQHDDQRQTATAHALAT